MVRFHPLTLYAVLAELVLHQIANLRLPYGVRRFESYTLRYVSNLVG